MVIGRSVHRRREGSDRLEQRVRYITSGELLEDLTAALADQTIHDRVRFYARFALLIIDEFGFDRTERAVCQEAASLWYKIIDARSQRVSTALVTNIDFESWADYLGDAPLAMAMLDQHRSRRPPSAEHLETGLRGDDRVQELLFELCSGLAEPQRPPTRGQKPHTISDAIFAIVFKVYSMYSSRRFSSDLREAHKRGFLSKDIPGAKTTNLIENPLFTPVLKELIAKSAAPLKAVETAFAIDSSGFSTNKFERWYDQKYGATKLKHVWVKVHICSGVKTNCVTAVRILDKDAADSPQFIPLVKETSRTFTISEVSADKAYASLENFEEVAGMGAQAFIAFRNNATGAIGGAFQKAFHYFKFKQDEYMEHYHKRSNVESTFSAIKRVFGDSIRSKTETAMVNEVLCKMICHNLACLVHAQCELGIESVFWKEKAEQEPRFVLPMMPA